MVISAGAQAGDKVSVINVNAVPEGAQFAASAITQLSTNKDLGKHSTAAVTDYVLDGRKSAVSMGAVLADRGHDTIVAQAGGKGKAEERSSGVKH